MVADGEVENITAVTKNLPVLDVPMLGLAGTLEKLETDANYWRWLAELPTSFVYKGCRPGYTAEMADTCAAQLKRWGFLFDPELMLWTKPYWWVVARPSVDDMLLRWSAVKRVEHKKERERSRKFSLGGAAKVHMM